MSAAVERLGQRCARLGLCSRKEATRYIRLGLVTVDACTVRDPATLVPSTASIELLERGRRMQHNKVTILLYKPLHYASCRAPKGSPLARKLLVPANRASICKTRHDPRQLSRLQPTDILDEASTGVLLFSQDGRIATRVARDPDLEKEFRVCAASHVTSSQLEALRAGLWTFLDEEGVAGAVDVCDVVGEENGVENLRVVLRGPAPSAKIRRACMLAGLHLEGIERVRIGHARLGDLMPGEWTVVPSNAVLTVTA